MKSAHKMNCVAVRAPSNIALSKYMGKTDPSRNLPENPSVSMTLSSLCTDLSVFASEGSSDTLSSEKLYWSRGVSPKLSASGQVKFLKHVERMRGLLPKFFKEFRLDLSPLTLKVEIKSANTFPHGSGIASSASSFAALTLGVATFYAADRTEFSKIFRGVNETSKKFRQRLAEMSRLGSGSSCRSFEGPFVTWEGEKNSTVQSKLEPLIDLVLIAGVEEKTVSSTEAHRLVKDSPHWNGRVLRAMNRHEKIVNAIQGGNFEVLARESWEEFQDMHGLFHTSNPPFSYWNDSTRKILDTLIRLPMDRVCLTMDAGPNVHCLVRASEAIQWKERLQSVFPELTILEDRAGLGAEILEV